MSPAIAYLMHPAPHTQGPGIGNLGSETSDRVFEVPGLPGRSFCSKVVNIMQVDSLPGE